MSVKLTVIMSVYNGECYLRQSIESVLNQTYRDFEFLIIDDGSSDSSQDIIKSYDDVRIRLIINQENKGLIGSLNKGLSEARGEYIARQDADDVCHVERFSRQLQLLESDKSLLLVGSQLDLIDERGMPKGNWKYPQDGQLALWFLLYNSAVAHSSSMYRKDTVISVGGYSADAIYAEDYDLWSKLSRLGKIKNLPDVLQYYRIHDEAVSKRQQQKQLETRFKISSDNINRLFEKPLDEASLKYISGCEPPHDYNDLICLIDGLNVVYDRFIRSHQCKKNTQILILNDVLERISSGFQFVGFQTRVKILISRAGKFPLSFWVKGVFMSFLLSRNMKNAIKRAIRPVK